MSQNLISYSASNPYRIPTNGKFISRICGTSYKWRWIFKADCLILDLYEVSRKYRMICDPILSIKFAETADGTEPISYLSSSNLTSCEKLVYKTISTFKRIARNSSVIVDKKFAGYDCDIISITTGAMTLITMEDYRYVLE